MVQIRELQGPQDPDLEPLSRLMLTTFVDPNVVLTKGSLAQFLAEPAPGRTFHALVAKEGDRVVGGVVFSFVIPSACGFSEYLVVDRGHRRQGIGRALVEARRGVLDRQARDSGLPGARGVFIEVESPFRTPREVLERERGVSIDPLERWRVFHRLGFLRVEAPYVQPPLEEGKEPVYYLDLMFCPWDRGVRESRLLPRPWLLETLEVIWRAWTPQGYRGFLEWFTARLGDGPVPLVPLFPEG